MLTNRRSMLGLSAFAMLAGCLPGCATTRRSHAGRPASKRRLARFAHVTDSHTQAERKGFEGTCAMWQHLNAQPDKPDLVLTGGDLIFDGFARTKQRTQEQWDLFMQAMRVHNKLPVTHCLGNHDIWGWNKKDSGAAGTEREYGKQWAIDVLGMSNAFYSLSCKGVKVIVLDSVQPRGEDTYEGGLGDAQFEWLQAELAASSAMPTVILTHIPAVHASMQLVDARQTEDKQWRFGGGSLLMDRVKLVNLLAQHPQVRCVLSGHIHMQERVDYAGTSWINSGAVCGTWWQPQQTSREFFATRRDDKSMLARPDRAAPGYGLLDIYDNGTIDWQYVDFGWEMQA